MEGGGGGGFERQDVIICESSITLKSCSIALRDVIKPKQLGILGNKSVEVKPVSIEPVLLMQRHYAKLHPFSVTS